MCFRRIIPADSADEFYCIMGQLSQEMLDYKTEDTNRLIKVQIVKKNSKILKNHTDFKKVFKLLHL